MRHAHPTFQRRVALLAAAGTVLLGAFPLAQRDGIPKNPDDRVITHVLNRLGYGPRPGDVERVKRMGLTAYINDQLNPSQIADTAPVFHGLFRTSAGREAVAPVVSALWTAPTPVVDAAPQATAQRAAASNEGGGTLSLFQDQPADPRALFRGRV